MDGVVAELQTCETGLGAHVRATTSGLYGLGGHYGWTWHPGVLSITLQPRAGLSYVDHAVQALPQRTQFELGAQLLVGYNRYRLALDYWHLSNAGMTQPNIGLDLVSVMVGLAF